MFGGNHSLRAVAILATAALVRLMAACGGSRSFPASDSSRNAGGLTTSAVATHGGAINVGSVEQRMKTDACPTIWAKSNECSNLIPTLSGAPFQVSP